MNESVLGKTEPGHYFRGVPKELMTEQKRFIKGGLHTFCSSLGSVVERKFEKLVEQNQVQLLLIPRLFSRDPASLFVSSVTKSLGGPDSVL